MRKGHVQFQFPSNAGEILQADCLNCPSTLVDIGCGFINVFSGENPGGSKNQKKRNHPERKPPVYTPHPDAVLKIVPVSNSLIICEKGKYP